jgi:hypothetical protein
MVRYLQSNSGIKVTSGACVSKTFGFVKPTRVTLSYVIQENTFWMKILPPHQAVKNEFPPEPIIISSTDDQELHQNTNGIARTANKKNKPPTNKTQICKVIYIHSFGKL